MRRALPKCLILGGTLLAASSMLSACADNNSSLFVAGVVSPEEGCVVEPDGETTVLFRGTMDLAITGNYFAVLLIGNQLVARADGDTLRTETNHAVIRGAVVTINSATGTTLAEYSTNASAFIPAAEGNDPGFGAAGVVLIPQDVAEDLANSSTSEVNVFVSVFGETLGNEEIESSTYNFVIELCEGCLIQCQATTTTGCFSSATAEDAEKICAFGQDQVVDCGLLRPAIWQDYCPPLP